MKNLIKCSFIFVLFLFFCGATLAQQSVLGGEGTAATKEQTPRSTKILKALPDGDQPAIAQPKSTSLPKGTVSDKVLEQAPKAPVTYVPVWKGLDKLSFSDKQNALIQLEVPPDLSAILLKQVEEIEELWKSGNFEQAIERLRSLEESGGLGNIAVGISWKVPIMASEPKWGTDVRIGLREWIVKPCLDFHDDTGNLFAVLKRGDDDPRFTVNISTDGGQTWQETFTYNGSYEIIDLYAAVVADYLYVGYVYAQAPDRARIRRFFTSNGEVDNVYSFQVVFDKNIDINEIAVTSNADQNDSRIYYFAILTDNSLVFCWDDEEGLSWQEEATGISNADRGLDACWNQDWTEYAIWVSFVDTYDQVHAARRGGGVWEDILLWSNLRNVTSVGAYEDRIIIVYEYTDHDIRYQVSYNGGDNWHLGAIAYSAEEPPYFHEAHVTGRRGGGFTVVYHEEVGGEPDTCWYRHRDYGTGPGTAAWSAPEHYNEVDVWTGWSMALEWIPPFDPYCHAYGSIWVDGVERGAYFDRMGQMLPGDVNRDGVVDLGDVLHLISYLYKAGPPPDPLWSGEVNCDGVIDLGDVLHLIGYLYKGGLPPNCC